MIYRDFCGIKLPNLAMGCMRLPSNGEGYADIDVGQVREMVAYCLEHGVNYFDTAWGYHGGASETVIGDALSEYERGSFMLASKFPGYDLNNMDKVEKIFEKQLEKCRVDYFDFYLFHNVCEMNIDVYLDPKYGIYDYLIAQKKNGRIRHLGFSCHGDLDVLALFLEAYGDDMEFCQLQLNYLDWTFQHGREKVEMLKARDIPVWVMEPVRGGKLVSIAPEYEERLRALRPDASPIEWAFRFVQSIPEVKTILSGMSDMSQLKENIKIFETNDLLNEEETAAILGVAADMLGRNVLPCTACRYCTDYCPQQLDIPRLISLYNEHAFSGGGFIAPMALQAIDEDKRPDSCVGCQSCEAVCPQQIKISEAMADFAARMKR